MVGALDHITQLMLHYIHNDALFQNGCRSFLSAQQDLDFKGQSVCVCGQEDLCVDSSSQPLLKGRLLALQE